MAEIRDALDQACVGFKPFELTLDGIGCFPNMNNPKVIWAGIQGDLATLRRLRDSVEQYIAPLGYPTEQRDFKPHLTIGRVKHAPQVEIRHIGDAVRAAEDRVISTMHAGEVSLMRSDLSSRGAKYTQLLMVTLK